MTHFNGPTTTITLDVPTSGVLSLSVEINLYSEWKEWVVGRYFFDTENDVNGTTELITFIDHGLHTGQAVFYHTDGGTENIGLVDGTEYFIRADDASGDRNTFQLYDTEANAEAGPSTTGRLDLTASGVGNGETHRIAADNSKFLPAWRTIGGDELTPGVEAGPYFFLQNGDLSDVPPQGGWRIISTDEDQTINYQGNLVAEESDTEIILVTPGRSVLHLGLQPVTQRVDEILTQTQLALFNGAVTIDTQGNGTPGTEFPIGTESVPVDNLTDALTIASDNGFIRFLLHGTITFTSSSIDTVWSSFGLDSVININGQDISGSHFNGISISGTLASPITQEITMNECMINVLTGFSGTIMNSAINGPVQLVSGTTKLFNCFSDIAGSPSPIIDADDQTGINLMLRGYNGGIQLENFTENDSVVTLGINTGRINIAANCTAFGDFQVRGVALLNNLSALVAGLGKTIDTSALVDATDLMITKQMVAGNVTISLDDETVTVFDEDGTTILVVLDVSTDGRIRTRTT